MLRLLVNLALAAACAGPALAAAGDFVINPLRVTLDRTSRAGEVSVRNDDAVPLRMQVEALTWRQDASGADQYEVADGLMFFPRVLEIPPGETRIVRVGVRAAPISREDAYRLFFEELPPPGGNPTGGTSLQVLLRVGVAVFVAPTQPAVKAAISGLEVSAGKAQWTVVNEGNVHFRIEQGELAGSAADGTRLFVLPIADRYFLAGTTKKLVSPIPPELCGRLAYVEALIVAEKLELKRKLDVDPRTCR
jgi:fimbrial chaperone protein